MTRPQTKLAIGDTSRSDVTIIAIEYGVATLAAAIRIALRQVTSREAVETPDPGGEGSPVGGVNVGLTDDDIELAHAICRDAGRREETSAGVRIALRALANRLKKAKKVARIA